MRAITYSAFRQDLKENIRRIRNDAEPLLVTNKDPEDNIVVLNQADYDGLMETLRIYDNPVQYDRILRGLEQVRAGACAEHELIEDED